MINVFRNFAPGFEEYDFEALKDAIRQSFSRFASARGFPRHGKPSALIRIAAKLFAGRDGTRHAHRQHVKCRARKTWRIFATTRRGMACSRFFTADIGAENSRRLRIRGNRIRR